MILRSLGFLFWIVLGLVIAWLSRTQGLGSAEEPGPGVFGLGLGLMMAGIGMAQLVAAVVRGVHARPADQVPGDCATAPAATATATASLVTLRMLALCATLVVYFFLFERLGYPLATFVLMLVLFIGFAQRPWKQSTLLAACSVALTYGVFKYLLGTQLPAGLLG